MSFNPFEGRQSGSGNKWYNGTDVSVKNGEESSETDVVEVEDKDNNNLKNAKVGDYYLNTDTGDLFLCTEHKEGKSKWKKVYSFSSSGTGVTAVIEEKEIKKDDWKEVTTPVEPTQIRTIVDEVNDNSFAIEKDKQYSYALESDKVKTDNLITISLKTGVSKEVYDDCAAARISAHEQKDGSLILYCNGKKPTNDIPLMITYEVKKDYVTKIGDTVNDVIF